MRKKAHLEFALLKAAEFFRDELRFGPMLPHQVKRIERLHKLTWHVLGHQLSAKDAAKIEEKGGELEEPPSQQQRH
jgi:hypothetical protein